jgi:hypothetical protein
MVGRVLFSEINVYDYPPEPVVSFSVTYEGRKLCL